MAKHGFSKELSKKTKEAIKKFGQYSFDDKGPHEVMELGTLINQFKNLSFKEKTQVAKDLKKNSNETLVLVELISSSKLTEEQIEELCEVGGEELSDFFSEPEDTEMEFPVQSISDLFGNGLFKK